MGAKRSGNVELERTSAEDIRPQSGGSRVSWDGNLDAVRAYLENTGLEFRLPEDEKRVSIRVRELEDDYTPADYRLEVQPYAEDFRYIFSPDADLIRVEDSADVGLEMNELIEENRNVYTVRLYSEPYTLQRDELIEKNGSVYRAKIYSKLSEED